MKKQNKLLEPWHWFKIITLGVAVGLSLQFVRAWTEPSVAPPGGNLGAPLNTGSVEQQRYSGLSINGDFASQSTGKYGLSASAPIFGVLGKDTDSPKGAFGFLGYNRAGVAGYESSAAPLHSPWGAIGWNGYGVFGQQYSGDATKGEVSGPFGALGVNGYAGYFGNGPVRAEGDIIAPRLIDKDNANFSIDPSDLARLNNTYNTGWVYADGDVCTAQNGGKCLSSINSAGIKGVFECTCRDVWYPSPSASLIGVLDKKINCGYGEFLYGRITGPISVYVAAAIGMQATVEPYYYYEGVTYPCAWF